MTSACSSHAAPITNPRKTVRRRRALSFLTVALGALIALPVAAGPASAATAQAAHPAKAAMAVKTASKAWVPATGKHLSVGERRAAFGDAVLAEAAQHAGAPYVYGAGGPGAFDCSGFTSYVFRQLGFSLPHTSYGQYAMVQHIPQGAARPGDLIFLNGLGHVAIYAGHGMMWDAPSPGGVVSERSIYSSAYVVGRIRL